MAEEEKKDETVPGDAGLGKIFAYSSAQFGGNIVNMLFTGWVMYFYTDDSGGLTPYVSVFIMGAAMMGGRIIDAISDPLIGFWSDQTRTRMGRRRPFMLVAAPFLVLLFIMLFRPLFPRGSTELAVTTVVVMSAFWFFFTAVMVPFLALLPEISTSSENRVRTTTFMAIAFLLANAYSGIAGPKMIEGWGYFPMACFSGALCIFFIYVTVFTIQEKGPAAAPEDRTEEKYSFIEAFGWTFRNRAFVVYIVASICQYLGFASLTASIPFIATRLMGESEGFVGTLYMVTLPSFVVAFILINRLTKMMEKAALLKISMFLLAAMLPFLFLFGRVDFGIPTRVAGMIFMGLVAFPMTGNQVLPMAILADITDYDEKLTGRRREAMYFSMQGFLQKFATAVSLGMQSLLFGLLGYSMECHLGVTLLGPVAGLFGFAGLIVFLYYPLDEKTRDMKGAAAA